VIPLDDRVFHFLVASREVGLHIYNLRSFECVDFKVFFHLWHNGGPNYLVEFSKWNQEQAAKWNDAVMRKSVRLTGANSLLVSVRHPAPRSSMAMEFSKFKSPVNDGIKSYFNPCISSFNAFNPLKTSFLDAGSLGPIPDPNWVSPAHGPLLQLWPILVLAAPFLPSVGDIFCWDTPLFAMMFCLSPRVPLRTLKFVMILGL